MAAPDSVKRLVENFDRQIDKYKDGQYNETQVRVDFIDPLFIALGWDVRNEKGYAEAYREVSHEFSLKMGGATKAPDYCFKIGQVPKFFLEAKKPSVPLKEASDPAFQLRRYAWSAKLPLSILSDFEELAVYDCRVRPVKTDKPSKARVQYIEYTDYVEKWDELEGLFSPEAIKQGAFDRYVESNKKKRGTAEVDDAFLKEIESWRELLAKNIRLRNPDLDPRHLNEAVQKTIDRIIFLRICEDRGIEPYGQLQGLVSGDQVYDRMKYVFHRADDRYNSGLFHFREEKGRESPDSWTLDLRIDDGKLKEILKRLYYPDSPYEFAVLPAEILGQVYEQFLGKVITPRGKTQVTIEDKPEVKKAGGVYYTPTYIVDYIVEHTVGKLVEDKTPEEVMGKGRKKGTKHPLRVLDPACGSGSFLIGAYQYLLDWYLDQYAKDPDTYTKTRPPRIYESDGPAELTGRTSVLTSRVSASAKEKNEIAASRTASAPRNDGEKEVSDGVKARDCRVGPAAHPRNDETGEDDGAEEEIGRARVPTGRGSHVNDENEITPSSPDADDPNATRHCEERSDAAISGVNPPKTAYRLTTSERKRILLDHIYGVDIDPQAVEVTKLSLLLKVLEGESAHTIANQLDLFHERALPDLADNIKCGNSLIGPDFYDQPDLELTEEEERRINAFDWEAEFKDVFTGENAGFDAVIGNPPYIRVRTFKNLAPEQIDYLERSYQTASHVWDIYLLFFEKAIEILRNGGRMSYIVPIQTLHQPNCRSVRALFLDHANIACVCDLSHIKVFDRAIVKNTVIVLEKGVSIDNNIEVRKPEDVNELFSDQCHQWPQWEVRENPNYSLKTELLSPIKHLCDKLREQSYSLEELCYVTFGLRSCAKGVGQGGKDRLITTNPGAENAQPYLEGRDINRYVIRPTGRFLQYIPSEMYSPRSPDLFETPKIVSQSMLSKMRIVASLDKHGYYVEQSLVCILPHGILTDPVKESIPSLEFLLGCINSSLNSFFFSSYIIDHSLGGGLIHATPGSQSQLLIPKLGDEMSSDLGAAVADMLSLHERLAEVKTQHDRTQLERRIAATDKQIDRLVYALYGLTDDEIKIIETATAR